jgi:hypothetical protein
LSRLLDELIPRLDHVCHLPVVTICEHSGAMWPKRSMEHADVVTRQDKGWFRLGLMRDCIRFAVKWKIP